jgi:hypothetical protein
MDNGFYGKDGHLSEGEIIIVCLSEDLAGPGYTFKVSRCHLLLLNTIIIRFTPQSWRFTWLSGSAQLLSSFFP